MQYYREFPELPKMASPTPSMYHTPIVFFNMLNTAKLWQREFCIIKDPEKIRKRQVSKIDHIKYFVNKYGTGAHFYHSVALIDWEKMPRADHKTNIKKKSFFAEWNKKFPKAVTGYDFIFDIDAKQIRTAYKEAARLKTFLDILKVPYTINFSGKKGFHIRISWTDLRRYAPHPLECPKLFKYIAQTLKNYLSLEHLDSIYDLTRIIRVPYSMHGSSNLICLPLRDWQFEKFKPEMATSENVQAIYPLRNRNTKKEYPHRNVERLLNISDTILKISEKEKDVTSLLQQYLF